MFYHVAQRLICLKYSNQDEESIRHALQNLKESFIDGRIWSLLLKQNTNSLTMTVISPEAPK